MEHLLRSTLKLLLHLLLLTSSLTVGEYPEEALYADTWKIGNASTCTCTVMTGWSEMKEYLKVQDMRARVQDAETILDSMNYAAIFDGLQNVTDRLNTLEDFINSQAIATSVTELFTLRKNVEALVNIMEHTNSSAKVYEQRAQLAVELEAISNITNDIWSRNPYKQKEDYKQEVSELRDRFSRCQKDVDLSPFPGDSLPLNVSMLDDWCPTEGSLRVGFPLTHRLESTAYSNQGMWFKDPQPLTNTSRTEVWEVLYTSSGWYAGKKFSTYASLSGNGQSQFQRTYMTGGGAVVYKNVMYYGYSTSLYKLNLESQALTSHSIKFQSVNYKGASFTTYLDLSVDEMGFWVIYSLTVDNKIAISKLDPDTLVVEKTWLTGVLKSDVCAAFMVCGRMYTIKSCNTRLMPSDPNYVFDTHTSKGFYSHYHVPSLYGDLRQLTYNPRERMLFGWDKAHMVTYSVGWGEEE